MDQTLRLSAYLAFYILFIYAHILCDFWFWATENVFKFL